MGKIDDFNWILKIRCVGWESGEKQTGCNAVIKYPSAEGAFQQDGS